MLDLVNARSTNCKITVTDVLGNSILVQTQSASVEKSMLDLSAQSARIYFVIINGEAGDQKVLKLMKE
jgi:hypothetical protein